MIKRIVWIEVDGDTFFQCFDEPLAKNMIEKLVKYGIDKDRIKLCSRMPNI